MNDKQTKTEAMRLVELAYRLSPEGEEFAVEEEFTVEEMVWMRSYLSSMRRSIDIVNKALARAWDEYHPGEWYDSEHDTWYLGKTKGKKVVDKDSFFEWLATLDAERLSKIVGISSIKVSGMGDLERETFLDETPTSANLSIQHKPRK